MSNVLLSPGTYPPPSFLFKLEYLIKKEVRLLPLFVVLIGLSALSQSYAILLVALLSASFLAGFLYHYHMEKFEPFYSIEGIHFKFKSTKYFVPRHVMAAFLIHEVNKFKMYSPSGNAFEIFRGLTIVVLDRRPRDPLGYIDPAKVRAISDTEVLMRTYIYGPYVLAKEGLGYEILLQGASRIVPGHSEDFYKKWLADRGFFI
jgi:hypothetical protein